MRICNHCGKLTAGRPLFCNHCGRSFSVKFCPRLHPNSRDAEACSQCGSRELSIPQDRLPIRFRALMLFLSIIPGLALIAISLLYIGYFFLQLIHNPDNLLVPMLYGLALAFAWFIWLQLPLLLLGLRSRRRTRK
jgi:uncharacterized membrane protein YvbJ